LEADLASAEALRTEMKQSIPAEPDEEMEMELNTAIKNSNKAFARLSARSQTWLAFIKQRELVWGKLDAARKPLQLVHFDPKVSQDEAHEIFDTLKVCCTMFDTRCHNIPSSEEL